MRFIPHMPWLQLVAIAAGRLSWKSYTIDVDTYEGGVFDRRSVSRDWDSLGLPSLVDHTVFVASMTALPGLFTTVWIFEEEAPASDRLAFLSWPKNYTLGRFVEVSWDGSHGPQTFYVAMFRDDPISQTQAALFKLTEM